MKSSRPAAPPATKSEEKADALPAGLRRYLYLTAATTGAAIMIVEILGAKMLAPYVGTSHFVWTAQIAVTLVALSTGYYVGGKLVDRSQRLGVIYRAIIFAAFYLGGAVLVVEPVAYWCLDFSLAPGSLMASAFLFFVPLALLAMVGPYFVRVLTSAVASVGSNIGRLTAISTLGSFAGTILVGYVFLPRMANSKTMYVTACTLLAVAAGYFFVWGRRQTQPVLAALAMLAALAVGGAGVASDRLISTTRFKEIYRANSNFGRLQVLDRTDDELRLYLNDFLTQDEYLPATKQSDGAFTYMLHDLAVGYNPEIHNVLCIGLGVGIVPMQFAHEGVRVDVVEINPAVIPVAKKYFDFDPSAVQLTIDDGRHYLNRCRTNYDAIILDAFVGDSSPSHLLSKEAFASMRKILKPGGVLVMNTFGNIDVGRDFFSSSVDKTLKQVFQQVRAHVTDVGLCNMFFVASDRPALELGPLPPIQMAPDGDCRDHVRNARQTIIQIPQEDGIVLTDDYNPLDYYDAANREALRKNLAMSASLYKSRNTP